MLGEVRALECLGIISFPDVGIAFWITSDLIDSAVASCMPWKMISPSRGNVVNYRQDSRHQLKPEARHVLRARQTDTTQKPLLEASEKVLGLGNAAAAVA